MTQPHTLQEIYQKDVHYAEKNMVGMRDHQEDYSYITRIQSGSEVLAVMSDGMGGHACGEVASKQAVEAFVESFRAYPAKSVSGKLAIALKQANDRLAATIREMPAMDGMGCTLVGMHIGPDGVNWISVGDSPLYLYRNGKLIRLNEDHSMKPKIDEALRSGKITPEEAASHPQRNALRSAVMGEELSMIDAPERTFLLQKGDVLVLASDGILTLTDAEIGSELQAGGAALQIAARLLSAVEMKRYPKQDNTSVQVVVVPDESGAPLSVPRRGGFSISRTALAKMIAVVVVLAALIVSGVLLVQHFFPSGKEQDKTAEPKGTLQVPAPVRPVAPPVPPAESPEMKLPDPSGVDSNVGQDVPAGTKDKKKPAHPDKESKPEQEAPSATNDKKKKQPTDKGSQPEKKPVVESKEPKESKGKPAPKAVSPKPEDPEKQGGGKLDGNNNKPGGSQ